MYSPASPTFQIWGTVEEVGVLFPSAQTHILIGLLKRGICYLIYLLIKSTEFGRFPGKGSLKHVPNRHTGSILGKHLPRATESTPSALHRDRTGEGGGTTRQDSRISWHTWLPSSQVLSQPELLRVQGVWLGKFLTCHVRIKHPIT